MKKNSIQTKILSSMFLVFLVAIVLIIVFISINQKNNLLDEKDNNVKASLETLAISVKNMMLTGNAPVLVKTMQDLSKQNIYKKIYILRLDGSLAFSDPATINDVNSNTGREFAVTERIKDDRSDQEKQLDNSSVAKVLSGQHFIKYSMTRLKENDYYLSIEREDFCGICHVARDKLRGIAHITVSTADIFNKIDSSRNILIIFFTIAGALLLGLIFLLIKRQIITPMLRISSATGEVEKGDFTTHISLPNKDEIGDFAENLNRFVSNLNRDIIQVKQASLKISNLSSSSIRVTENKVKNNISEIEASIHNIDGQAESTTSGVEQLTATVESIVRNIESIMNSINQQASAVEESSSSIEEMVRNIEQTTTMSNQTKDISLHLNEVAADGGEAVRKAILSIKEVSDYSQQIIRILSLITGISEQTNLLAMNASIEAAHAGEAGKGFAIVATEIRSLSEDTSKNAGEIGVVVDSIIKRIGDSVNLAEKAGVGLDTIMTYSNQSAQIIGQLNISMEEQNHGAKEILRAIQELVQITEEVKLSVHEQNTATDEFAKALKDIRDLAIQNKDNVKKHINSLTSLIQAVEDIKSNIGINQELAGNLKTLMDKFITRES